MRMVAIHYFLEAGGFRELTADDADHIIKLKRFPDTVELVGPGYVSGFERISHVQSSRSRRGLYRFGPIAGIGNCNLSPESE